MVRPPKTRTRKPPTQKMPKKIQKKISKKIPKKIPNSIGPVHQVSIKMKTISTLENEITSTIIVTPAGIDDDESVYNAGIAATSSVVDGQIWPSMQDLNTRLRRVITSYQRNYKKEELKQQQKAKVCKSQDRDNFVILFFFWIILF